MIETEIRALPDSWRVRPMGVADLFVIVTVFGVTMGIAGYFEASTLSGVYPGELNWMLRWLNRAGAMFFTAVPVSGLACLIYRWRLDGWPKWVPGHGLLLFLGLKAVIETGCGFVMTALANHPDRGYSFRPVGIYFATVMLGSLALLPFVIRSVKGHRASWKWLGFTLAGVMISRELLSLLTVLTLAASRYRTYSFVEQAGSVVVFLLGALFVVAWLVAVVRGCRAKEGLGWLHWWGVASAFSCTVMYWIVAYLQILYFQNHAPPG